MTAHHGRSTDKMHRKGQRQRKGHRLPRSINRHPLHPRVAWSFRSRLAKSTLDKWVLSYT